jgi:energy-coupling factor transporter ATP-binding protein EcfA2
MRLENCNPFATRFVRPDEAEFLESANDEVTNVAKLFLESENCIGQIVGPHGSGKTTLTYAVEPLLRSRFPKVRRMTIRSSRVANRRFDLPGNSETDSSFWMTSPWPKFPLVEFFDQKYRQTQPEYCAGIPKFSRTSPADQRTIDRQLLIVDGIERIGFLNRLGLVAACKRMRLGLLLTTHRPIPNIKVLDRISPDKETFHRIVDQLLIGYSGPITVSPQTIEHCYFEADQNYREALMLLYDKFQLQSRSNTRLSYRI